MGLIRVLLALSVLFAHVGVFPPTDTQFVGGVMAVQSFFMISGFYMALVLNQGYANRGDFYFNRFLRLYPTYWVVLAMSVVWRPMFEETSFPATILNSDVLHWDGKLLLLGAILSIFGSDVMMFFYPDASGLHFTTNFAAHSLALHRFHPIPQVWTLPIEMAFYAVAPFIVNRRFWLLSLVAASLALRYLIYTYVAAGDPWTYRFFPTELAFFCAGSLAFHAYNSIKSFAAGKYIGAAMLVVLAAYIVLIDRVPVAVPDTVLFPGLQLQFYIAVLVTLPFIFMATRSSRSDQWLGELSYPIYIAHIFVLSVLLKLPSISGNKVYDTMLYTLALSAAINVLIQMPIEKMFKRSSQSHAVDPDGARTTLKEA